MTRVYLSGPMSNIPSFNFPAFISAAERLRLHDWDVVSPHELDKESNAEDYELAMASPDGSHGTTKQTWGDCLARDVKILADTGITGIVFLEGWEKSRGARLEAFVGLQLGFDFYLYDDDEWVGVPVVSISRNDVLHEIYGALT